MGELYFWTDSRSVEKMKRIVELPEGVGARDSLDSMYIRSETLLQPESSIIYTKS